MAPVSLDDPQSDAGLQQVRRVGVTERMDRDLPCADACRLCGCPEGPLDAAFGHGGLCGACGVAIPAEGREEKPGMCVVAPVRAHDLERGVRKRDTAVLSPLATRHVDHQALAVDLRHLQALGFLKAAVHRNRPC